MCPLIHSKVMQPTLLCRVFIMGCSRLAWVTFMKLRLVDDSRLSQREFTLTHLESVFIWRWLVLGVSCRVW